MINTSRPEEAFRAAVLAALGSAPEVIEPGRLQRFSVNGKRGDTAGWCQMFADGRAGVFGDFRAGLSSIWTERERCDMTRGERADMARRVLHAAAERKRVQAAERAARAPALARLWHQCLPVPSDGSGDDSLTLYLRRRLVLGPGEPLRVPAALRLHPGLPYYHDGECIGTWPAMMAALIGSSGELATLHRTWIGDDGRKAPVPGPAKKLAPAAGVVIGGCIRLVDADQWRGELLGIAEGIETALAARCASGVPTVAAYSAGSLAAWVWPRTLRRLMIFADADPAGAKASAELARRARMARLHVRVLTPSTPGTDWADIWSQRKETSK